VNKVKLTIAGLLLASACAAQTTVLPFLSSPQTPSITTITTVGVQGTTQYCYWVVAIYAGGKSAPSGPACTLLANATLGASNYDVVNFLAPTGPLVAPTGYDILRTATVTPPTGACGCSVATNQSASPVNDQSNSLSAYTLATSSTTTLMYLDNTNYGNPVLTFKSGAVTAVPVLDVTAAAAQQSTVYSVYGSITTAQINTGLTIVPAVAGRAIKILGALVQAVGGAAAGCTAIQIDDTAGTPVVGLSWTVAALTSGTFVTSDTAPAAGALTATTFLTALTTGQGLQILKTGGSCTTLTSMNYRVLFTYQ
jgi:hypothetical protein